MKYTIEITPNGMTKTFEFEGKQYSETWVRCDDYSSRTIEKGITTQLEDADILQDYEDLIEALNLDDLDELWDRMEEYEGIV
jgi:hypothetical protein